MGENEQSCRRCEALRAELALANVRADKSDTDRERLRAQLRELAKLVELQRADLNRYKREVSGTPNQPERVPEDQLQLAFERILAGVTDPVEKALLASANDEAPSTPSEPLKKPKEKTKKRHPHGRRDLELENLPVEEVHVDPDEVPPDGDGFVRIDEEVGDRVAYRKGAFIRIRLIRGKWVRKDCDVPSGSPVITAPLPESVWPNFMGDPSAIANVIVSKYDDILPLNRQERISARQGFVLPRSTQCSWLSAAHSVLYRIVDGMFAEAKKKSFCIGVDATGARVRDGGDDSPHAFRPGVDPRACEPWHVFVFVADRDHVLFQGAPVHNSDTVAAMLKGFKGNVLADAASIFNPLYRDHGMTECGCWFHQRRYVWRGLATDPERALEGLAIIRQLFKVARDCASVPMPKRTLVRAERARPVLALFERWVEQNRARVDPRGPLDAAFGYYRHQRQALHRFLEDGRIRLDNNLSEQALRNLVLGRYAWMYFQNVTGLRWYTVFRSLIASCALHDLNAQDYLEQVLRLAPHWKTHRMLELAPKHWAKTCERLDARHQRMLHPPWSSPSKIGDNRRVA